MRYLHIFSAGLILFCHSSAGIIDKILLKKHYKYFKLKRKNFDNVKFITRKGFTVIFDPKIKSPIIVSYELKAEDTIIKVERASQGAFKPDPTIGIEYQATKKDYKGSGWHKGHLAPSNDMRRCEEIQRESFYFTNIVPQHPSLNTVHWARLEKLANNYAQTYKKIHIITGPIYSIPLPDGKFYKTIGKSKLKIPTWFYKVIIKQNESNDKLDVLSFMMPNKKLCPKIELEEFFTPIVTIEDSAQLNLLRKDSVEPSLLMVKEIPEKLWRY